MGGCLTANREITGNENEIRHNTMQKARRSTFWENAALVPEGKLNTDSSLDDTVNSWQSCNLYEMSTTQCARLTQSKLKSKAELSEVDVIHASVTDVQKDFDINSPIASETFQNQSQVFEDYFPNSRTNSTLQEQPQQSFEITQSLSDLAKVSDVDATDVTAEPSAETSQVKFADLRQTSPSTPIVMYDPRSRSWLSYSSIDSFDEPKVRRILARKRSCFSNYSSVDTFDEPKEPKPEPRRISPIKFLNQDVTAKSYSTVDEFDEPKEAKENENSNIATDSFEKLLADPTNRKSSSNLIVSTLSGRFGSVAKHGLDGVAQPVSVQYMSEEQSDMRHKESFEIRSYQSFLASVI